MSLLKISLKGFFISFIGSIPFGYLNLIGFEIYNNYDFNQMILYLFGIVLIEMVYIFITLQFAEKLIKLKKLTKFINIFSVVFMFVLAIYFFINSSTKIENLPSVNLKVYHSTFITGVFLSSINFIQIPFWLSWNLTVLNNNNKLNYTSKFLYIFSAGIGTFCGMLLFILAFYEIVKTFDFSFKILIPVIFAGLGLFQFIKLIRESKNSKH